MDQPGEPQGPEIFMPTEVATATGPDGHRLVFFTVPQLELLIKRVLAARPKEYTYRWAYHPAHKVHLLFFGWPAGESGAIALPEGVGEIILQYMVGITDVYITTLPVQERLQGDVDPKVIREIISGLTVSLPEVRFQREA